MKLFSLFFAIMTGCLLSGAVPASDMRKFEVGDGAFMMNGEPYVVKAAELHYPRIPRPYWEHRIQQCKALGMNTICLYVFWNLHESTPGVFDFSGQNDLAEFIRLCHKNDMNVILRPGPYVCAEWEMGGLPWWLLQKKDIRLRENDPYFLERVKIFEDAVAGQVSDLTADKGGPIIMVQVENEYGSYGEDKEYVANIRDMVRGHYPGVPLFQCDWSSNFTKNGLDDLVWTMNFGTGANIDQQFEHLKQLRPDSPLMCSEFWSGWFDKWGAHHETRPADDMIAGIDEMLSKGISFSLYMTHGGTNWGHWAGANSPGFDPDVTSYDYDAPISESGQITPKYMALRKTLAKYADGRLPRIPASPKAAAIPAFRVDSVAPLFDNLPEPVRVRDIKNMEEFGQGFGSIMYRTELPRLKEQSVLTVNEPHDYAQIFVNGRFIGKLDRRNGERRIVIPAVPDGGTLDILVEAMGRINFGRAIKDFKGISENVELSLSHSGRDFVCDIKDWEVFLFPDDLSFYTSMKFRPVDGSDRPRGVYRGSFDIKKPADTFLNFESWGKGLVYVNGYPLGRIWSIGPQQTLYTPGCWLKKGHNEIVIFDITGPDDTSVEGLTSPIIDKLDARQAGLHRNEGETLKLDGLTPVATGEFVPGNGWQQVRFDRPAEGRYVCLEALDSHDGKDRACVAELYLLDENGNRLSRESWTVDYADSEEVAKNRSADKMFDLQESTFWATDKNARFPHSVVLDLGARHTLTGLQYLPRMEADPAGAVRKYRIYVSPTPFEK